MVRNERVIGFKNEPQKIGGNAGQDWEEDQQSAVDQSSTLSGIWLGDGAPMVYGLTPISPSFQT